MNEQLNSAQLQQVNLKVAERMNKYANSLQLRKWAVEQAVAVVVSGRMSENVSVAVVADEIYDFIVKDATAIDVEPF
jgi:hypothetical protein